MVLPLLKSDLLSVMQAVTEEKLSEINVEFSDKAAACVIMASEGYPAAYEKGFEISLPSQDEGIYVAGAALKDGKLVTNGGRVLGVSAVADSLQDAVDKAYEKVAEVTFAHSCYRHDIGAKALRAER